MKRSISVAPFVQSEAKMEEEKVVSGDKLQGIFTPQDVTKSRRRQNKCKKKVEMVRCKGKNRAGMMYHRRCG